MQDTEIHYGTVKFFNEGKNFGFIVPDDGGDDMFVSRETLDKSGLETLRPHDPVTYEIYENKDKTKKAAQNIKLI